MKEDLYISLLYKKLSQNITAAEQETLNAWLEASEDNQQIAESVEMSWKMGSGYNDPVVVDLDEDFAELETKMDALEVEEKSDEKPAAPVRKMPRRNWWSVAASLLILVSLGYLLRNYFRAANDWEQITVVDKNEEALVLSDGTKVWVNENSTFSRPGNFPVKERRVRLKGEAFFEVVPDANRPFIVETRNGEVKVLGTSFNVRDMATEEEMEVQVMTGRVQLQSSDESQKIYLEANEKGVYNKKNKTLKKLSDASGNALFWKDGKLTFEEQPLNKVLRELEKQFKVTIQLSDEKMGSCPFTSSFNDEKLDAILPTIGGVFGMEIKTMTKNNYQLDGGNCR